MSGIRAVCRYPYRISLRHLGGFSGVKYVPDANTRNVKPPSATNPVSSALVNRHSIGSAAQGARRGSMDDPLTRLPALDGHYAFGK